MQVSLACTAAGAGAFVGAFTDGAGWSGMERAVRDGALPAGGAAPAASGGRSGRIRTRPQTGGRPPVSSGG
ncbi:hypothetical protein GCM10012285_62110 [Streptomyces kronopolitis]|uniref:Uncharacterized protein n=1 Tax=Streptomyces kronopolitis TaxID=1612435 RepID=A0ABQ2K1T4_9ACTN|nr:hypothetical protein GCM10012285_62110 [Streptomyces kronopolitis]